MADKTITEEFRDVIDLFDGVVEDIKEQMCDEFCKWPHEAESDTALNAICEECPLQKL